jgi:hypothetical protein
LRWQKQPLKHPVFSGISYLVLAVVAFYFWVMKEKE